MKQTIAEKYSWSNIDTDFTVEDTRKLAATKGKDGIIIISWIDNGDGTVRYNTATAGKNKQYSLQAASIRDWIMSLIGGSDGKPVMVEDRIHEHID